MLSGDSCELACALNVNLMTELIIILHVYSGIHQQSLEADPEIPHR